MLQNSNLQFTNATKFNDPFDSHPALFDYSNVPIYQNSNLPADYIRLKEKNSLNNFREGTWICCLSKVYDSLLMWSYYNGHKGICIGLNLDAVISCCRVGFWGLFPPSPEEVKYKNIHQKPDFFKDHPSFLDMLVTKAKDWEHEQEVRIITTEPQWVRGKQAIPNEFKTDDFVDFKEIRYYPYLAGECFESVYLGVNMLPRYREAVIKTAKKLNSQIKIYQMAIDPEAFKLRDQLIE